MGSTGPRRNFRPGIVATIWLSVSTPADVLAAPGAPLLDPALRGCAALNAPAAGESAPLLHGIF